MGANRVALTTGCGHCKKAKPEFVSAADKFADDPKVELAAVDCTVDQQLCAQNEVRGYPTFKYFNYYKNTKPYNGGRTVSASAGSSLGLGLAVRHLGLTKGSPV